MSARVVEAAAKVIAERENAGLPVGPYDRETAHQAIAAADAVMFDDAAVERAAEALAESMSRGGEWWMHSENTKDIYRKHARAVIAALKAVA